MIELFLIFKFSFVLCILSGMALSYQGAHLVTRKQSLQILALAQAGLFGSLVGKIIDPDNTIVVLITSLAVFLLVKFFIFKSKKLKETFFIVIYISLMALGYLMISIFPSLDSHMSLGLFGDVVSLRASHTLALILVYIILNFIFFFLNNRFWRNSLDNALMNIEKVDIFEEVIFSIGFVISLYGLGLLYTVAFFIIPTVISGTVARNLKKSMTLILVVSSLASLTGLLGSIAFPRLSTVPSQIVLLILLLVFTKFHRNDDEKIRSNIKG